MGDRRSSRASIGIAVVLVVVALAGAVWMFPLTARGGGWPTGTIRVEQALVGDPALFEDVVAVSNGNRWRGFDIGSGEEAWKTGRCNGATSAGATAIQDGPILIVRCRDEIRALDLRTGSFRWTYEPGGSWSMLRVRGGRVLVALIDHVDVLDLDNGELAFRWDGEHVEEQEVIVAGNDDLVVVGDDDQVIALGPDGKERWRRGGMPAGGLWASDELVAVRDQEVIVYFDAATGEVDMDLGYPESIRKSMFVAEDAHHTVLARNDEDGVGVSAIDLESLEPTWWRTGASFVAAGPHHVAVEANGSCRVLRITTGKTEARCSERRWTTVGVGFHDDRVAITASTFTSDRSTVVVRDL